MKKKIFQLNEIDLSKLRSNDQSQKDQKTLDDIRSTIKKSEIINPKTSKKDTSGSVSNLQQEKEKSQEDKVNKFTTQKQVKAEPQVKNQKQTISNEQFNQIIQNLNSINIENIDENNKKIIQFIYDNFKSFTKEQQITLSINQNFKNIFLEKNLESLKEVPEILKEFIEEDKDYTLAQGNENILDLSIPRPFNLVNKNNISNFKKDIEQTIQSINTNKILNDKSKIDLKSLNNSNFFIFEDEEKENFYLFKISFSFLRNNNIQLNLQIDKKSKEEIDKSYSFLNNSKSITLEINQDKFEDLKNQNLNTYNDEQNYFKLLFYYFSNKEDINISEIKSKIEDNSKLVELPKEDVKTEPEQENSEKEDIETEETSQNIVSQNLQNSIDEGDVINQNNSTLGDLSKIDEKLNLYVTDQNQFIEFSEVFNYENAKVGAKIKDVDGLKKVNLKKLVENTTLLIKTFVRNELALYYNRDRNKQKGKSSAYEFIVEKYKNSKLKKYINSVFNVVGKENSHKIKFLLLTDEQFRQIANSEIHFKYSEPIKNEQTQQGQQSETEEIEDTEETDEEEDNQEETSEEIGNNQQDKTKKTLEDPIDLSNFLDDAEESQSQEDKTDESHRSRKKNKILKEQEEQNKNDQDKKHEKLIDSFLNFQNSIFDKIIDRAFNEMPKNTWNYAELDDKQLDEFKEKLKNYIKTNEEKSAIDTIKGSESSSISISSSQPDTNTSVQQEDKDENLENNKIETDKDTVLANLAKNFQNYVDSKNDIQIEDENGILFRTHSNKEYIKNELFQTFVSFIFGTEDKIKTNITKKLIVDLSKAISDCKDNNIDIEKNAELKIKIVGENEDAITIRNQTRTYPIQLNQKEYYSFDLIIKEDKNGENLTIYLFSLSIDVNKYNTVDLEHVKSRFIQESIEILSLIKNSFLKNTSTSNGQEENTSADSHKIDNQSTIENSNSQQGQPIESTSDQPIEKSQESGEDSNLEKNTSTQNTDQNIESPQGTEQTQDTTSEEKEVESKKIDNSPFGNDLQDTIIDIKTPENYYSEYYDDFKIKVMIPSVTQQTGEPISGTDGKIKKIKEIVKNYKEKNKKPIDSLKEFNEFLQKLNTDSNKNDDTLQNKKHNINDEYGFSFEVDKSNSTSELKFIIRLFDSIAFYIFIDKNQKFAVETKQGLISTYWAKYTRTILNRIHDKNQNKNQINVFELLFNLLQRYYDAEYSKENTNTKNESKSHVLSLSNGKMLIKESIESNKNYDMSYFKGEIKEIKELYQKIEKEKDKEKIESLNKKLNSKIKKAKEEISKQIVFNFVNRIKSFRGHDNKDSKKLIKVMSNKLGFEPDPLNFGLNSLNKFKNMCEFSRIMSNIILTNIMLYMSQLNMMYLIFSNEKLDQNLIVNSYVKFENDFKKLITSLQEKEVSSKFEELNERISKNFGVDSSIYLEVKDSYEKVMTYYQKQYKSLLDFKKSLTEFWEKYSSLEKEEEKIEERKKIIQEFINIKDSKEIKQVYNVYLTNNNFFNEKLQNIISSNSKLSYNEILKAHGYETFDDIYHEEKQIFDKIFKKCNEVLGKNIGQGKLGKLFEDLEILKRNLETSKIKNEKEENTQNTQVKQKTASNKNTKPEQENKQDKTEETSDNKTESKKIKQGLKLLNNNTVLKINQKKV